MEALGFHVRPLIKTIWSSDGKVAVGRVMEQIFFCSSAQITMTRRFISGFIMQTDATFNINKLRLLLSTCIGVTNTGKTFSFCHSFISSESTEAFTYMWKCIYDLI